MDKGCVRLLSYLSTCFHLTSGIIEKSAIDGQRQYHEALAREMRAHIKAHPTEFGVAGEEDVPDVDEGQNDVEGGRTEAQEYAAQNRRSNHDEDYWVLQGALDSVMTGFKSIGSGIATAAGTISDLVSPLSKGMLMVLLIAILLASNVYTYMARPVSQHKAKKLQRFGPSEEDVTEALRIILDRRAASTPQQEISELLRLLDEVDARSALLRESLPVEVSQPKQLAELD